MGMSVTQRIPGPLISPPDERRPQHTRSHFVLAVLLSLVFVVTLSAIGFHGYIAWLLGRPAIAPLSSNPLEAIGVPYEDVRFASANRQTMLDGWYLPAEGAERTVIFSHGYGANREELWVPIYDLAKAANMLHYNVLMFDYGFVKPNQTVTGGVQETQELLGAIDYVKSKGAKQVFVWGFSMGAGTALQTALVSHDITGMILDSTFLLTPDMLYHNIRQHIDLPRFPSLDLIRFFFPFVNGASLKQIPYQNVISHTYDIPIFMIHGKLDEKAPYEQALQLFDNQKDQPRSKLWLLPKGRHELLYIVNQKEYLKRTLSFLQDVSEAENPKLAADAE